jgi:REP element-mobilizing transposase RayT
MDNFAVMSRQAGPERAQVHLKLIETEGPDTFEEHIKMILEPAPDLSRSDSMWRCRGRANSIVDRWKM